VAIKAKPTWHHIGGKSIVLDFFLRAKKKSS
jgi:hypothetical protein